MISTLTLMHRYLFVLAEEAERMRRARASRTFTRLRRFHWRTLPTVAGTIIYSRLGTRRTRLRRDVCARLEMNRGHRDHQSEISLPRRHGSVAWRKPSHRFRRMCSFDWSEWFRQIHIIVASERNSAGHALRRWCRADFGRNHHGRKFTNDSPGSGIGFSRPGRSIVLPEPCRKTWRSVRSN